jgi:polar amino acid transport system substrate-binding protein
MARNTRVFAAIAALSLVVASCGGNSDSFSLVKEGTLTVCTDSPYEPFEYQTKDGTWTGFDMDIMRKIAEANDLELEVTVQPFDGIWLAPAARTCDVVASSLTITEERARKADFTDGYFESFQSLLVRNADKDTLNTIESLAGKTVAVQTGTTGEKYAKANAPEAKIKSFEDASAMFLALESNQVDAILQDFPINAFRAVKQGTSTVSVKFNTEPEQYGFAVAKGNVELLKLLNAGLAELRAGDGYDTIYAKYFGKD